MCGICGYYQFISQADQTVLKEMNDQLFHRGPDDEGFYCQGKVGFAARRLSIIDLVTGHQPLSSCSGKTWIAYNGEVYNFSQLRKELQQKGYQFKTHTDTEVIVNLYEEYGDSFVTHLRGMFAIAIHDQKKDRLVLARDRIGIKPLYYTIKPENGNLVFASELKAILKYPGIKREIDRRALDLFLSLEYIPAPYSIFIDIKKLPAGHILIYERGQLTIKRYWQLEKYQTQANFSQLKEEFHHILTEAVKIRMIADVPLGAFLSGGIDSSAIVATMAGLSSQPIKTFSIGFEEKSYCELPYSNMIARQFKTDHFCENLAPDIQQLVMFLADYLDEPLGDFSNFPTYLVAKTARKSVTVALSGDGGDEIFGGYEHYIAQKMCRFLDLPPWRLLHSWIPRLSQIFPPSELKKGIINRIKRFAEGLEHHYKNRHFRWMIFLSRWQKEHLYADEFLRQSDDQELFLQYPFSQHFNQSADLFNGINQDLYLDLNTYLVDDILVKVDRMSMAASLEARVPLLDHKMVEFAFSLPSRFKLKGISSKWFFKKAMAGILPPKIIHRQKEGFSIPIKSWLKKELKEIMLTYLSEKRIKDSGLFNYAYVQSMINDHLGNRQNHAHRLWSLISFFIWKEKFCP